MCTSVFTAWFVTSSLILFSCFLLCPPDACFRSLNHKNSPCIPFLPCFPPVHPNALDFKMLMTAVIPATCTGRSKLFDVTQCRRASSSRYFEGSQSLHINLTAFQVYWTYRLRTRRDYDRSKRRKPRHQRQRVTSHKIPEVLPQRDVIRALLVPGNHNWYKYLEGW